MGLATGLGSERLFPGFLVTGYDISPDDKRVVFSALDSGGKPHLWLASLDRRFPPRQVSSAEEDEPFFGSGSELFFRVAEGKSNFVYRAKEDGSGRQKALPDPILQLEGISPDGQWVVAWQAVPGEESTSGLVALNTGGRPPVRICDRCEAAWSRDGKWFYTSVGRMARGEAQRTLAIPVQPGRALPTPPPSGNLAGLPGVQEIPRGWIVPGPSPAVYAFTKKSVHRNLYRVPIP